MRQDCQVQRARAVRVWPMRLAGVGGLVGGALHFLAKLPPYHWAMLLCTAAIVVGLAGSFWPRARR